MGHHSTEPNKRFSEDAFFNNINRPRSIIRLNIKAQEHSENKAGHFPFNECVAPAFLLSHFLIAALQAAPSLGSFLLPQATWLAR